MSRSVKLFVLFTVALFSCHREPKTPVPSDVIPEAKMAEILIDIHLLEASSSLGLLPETGKTTDAGAGILNVYKKHGVEKDQFSRSLRYYSSEPEKINAIYEVVLNQLNKLQAEAMNKK